MNLPVEVSIEDYREAMKMRDALTLGHYFAFVDQKAEPRRGRRERLQAEPSTGFRVVPLVKEAFSVAGMTLTPRERHIDPLGAVVTDRDLYRAEQDTIYLFVAMPAERKDVELCVECNGEPFTTRELELSSGVGIETLSMLLPGSYEAQLSVGGNRIGTPVAFTVAEYTLAPLAGRLVSHEIDRKSNELRFELDVESYQVPFDGELEVSLADGDIEVSSIRLKPGAPGRYRGCLAMKGGGPFRLRLVSTVDAERIAEVAIPGSRARERDVTILGELGKERLFSMMPEPGALSVRGGYVTEGDVITTPIVVEELLADRWVLHAKKDLESLNLVVLDLSSGEMRVVHHGDAKSGDEILVESESSLCTVFVGAVVGGRPFEGYSTFIRPSRFAIDLQVPAAVRPGDDLVVRLACDGASEAVPVLLAVRDHRLTATDRPSVSLGASMKKAVADATEGMDQGFFDDAWLVPPPVMAAAPTAGAVRFRSADAIASLELGDADLEATGEMLFDAAGGIAAEPDTEVEAPRTDFPEVLFFDVVPVDDVEEVVIPVRDSLGSFAVEAFALVGGDWTASETTVVVDKPVRIDLELPPAVHADDTVFGRLRASTSSGRGKVHVTRNGERIDVPDVVETPIEIEIDVVPGTYVARVEDLENGEVDSVELHVGEPGVLKSHVRELGLLLEGDHVTLDSADALTLRVLPAVDESFECLITATAGYAHLCCEQTAAKILAATFMYLAAKNDGDRRKAEQIILAGIEREKKMLRPGRGFTMYPDARDVHDYFSRAAVRYLWNLDQLGEIPGISSTLRRAAEEGLSLADTAAEAHGMKRVPSVITSAAEAYAAASAGDASSAERYFADVLDFSKEEVTVGPGAGLVDARTTLAYAGASLIAMRNLEKGVRLANQVTRQFNDQGRLYSTLDSAAAIVLMIQLRASGIVSGQGRLRVNGEEMTAAEATSLSDRVESLEVLEGVAALEINRIRTENWNDFEAGFPVRIGFRDERGKKKKRFRMGERAELAVTLPNGYQLGDLVHVSLPACLSWIHGGGKLKQFTMDFEGRNELSIPVIATSRIRGQQHFAVCVRNMFEEERAANPGLLTVEG